MKIKYGFSDREVFDVEELRSDITDFVQEQINDPECADILNSIYFNQDEKVASDLAEVFIVDCLNDSGYDEDVMSILKGHWNLNTSIGQTFEDGIAFEIRQIVAELWHPFENIPDAIERYEELSPSVLKDQNWLALKKYILENI